MLALPPLVLRLSRRNLWQHLILAFLSSPVIHILFPLLLDWHEYMPFVLVPSLRSLL